MFWQENEPVTASGTILPGVLAASNQFRQRGVTLNVSHRLSALSTVSLNATRLYALSVSPSVALAVPRIESIQDTVRLGLTRQLGQRTDGSLGVRWVNFDSDVSPYHELAVLAALAHSF